MRYSEDIVNVTWQYCADGFVAGDPITVEIPWIDADTWDYDDSEQLTVQVSLTEEAKNNQYSNPGRFVLVIISNGKVISRREFTF